jgi:integrase
MKLSTFRYRRAVPRRSRRPLTHREVRALLAAADRQPLALDLKCITMLAEELD